MRIYVLIVFCRLLVYNGNILLMVGRVCYGERNSSE
uniref:Uncharacterized protein n=1 Tax=Siphoviridae sp. ctRcp9 TaxID=2825504 RepID=A0A8S5PLT3_9CAUD|nr:MAG TPA: hypothetical protein [Siphoviridae sp. ctRcp9]